MATTRESRGPGALGKAAASAADGFPATRRALEEELATLRAEQAKLRQGIFEAAQVQRRLCAPRELLWGEYEIAGEIFPVRHLSGDFFKALDLGSALGLAVGDIAGKGLSAGLWLTHLLGLLERSARRHEDPTAAVAEINRELCKVQGEPPMTALFLARIEAEGSELTYCNAGLPAPLLLRSDGRMESLQEGGPMLGALREAKYDAGRITLSPGDTLIAYSDGVVDCRNSRDEEFDTKRLSTAAAAAGNGSASGSLFSVLGAALDFANGCAPADDLTLLVVRQRAGALRKSAQGQTRHSSMQFGGRTAVNRPRNAGRQAVASQQLS
jgi:sigma-B regulation protein RsbU (phosphoserine phosphatase)